MMTIFAQSRRPTVWLLLTVALGLGGGAEAQRGRVCATPSVIRQSLRKHGLPARPLRQAGLSPRGTIGTAFLPTLPLRGTIRGLHIVVRFPQDADVLANQTNAHYQRLLWDTSNPMSMASFYREMSFGQLTLTGDTVGPIIFGESSTTPLGVARGAVIAGTPPPNFSSSVANDAGKTALSQLISRLDANTDFSRYDSDGDGRVDLVIVTYANLNTATAGMQATPFGTAAYFADPIIQNAFQQSMVRLRALGVPAPASDEIRTGDGVVVDQWVFVSNDFNFLAGPTTVSTSPQNGMSVYAHEIGHSFGLPDLIDESGLIALPSAGTGLFDGMSLGNRNFPNLVNGVSSLGFIPSNFLGGIVHFTPWAKFALGWLTPTNLTGAVTNQALRPIETFPDCFRLNVNANPQSSEYYLIENRQNLGFDANLVGTRITPTTGAASPGTGTSQQAIHGLLLWHIDERVIENSILLNQPASDPLRPGIKLVQADGRDDMFRPLPGPFGVAAAIFDLTSFGFGGFTPTGNVGDDSDTFPGTRNMVHIGDGSDNRALLIDNAGLTPTNNLASTLTYAGGVSGIILDSIREQLPAVVRATGGNDILANITCQTLAQLTTSGLTLTNPLASDRLENFTPTITASYSTTHPLGVTGNQLTTSSISLALTGVVGTAVDIDGDTVVDGVPFVQNGVAVSVPGVGVGTFQVAQDGTVTFQPPLLNAGAHTVKISALNLLGQRVTTPPITFFLQQRRVRGGLTMISFPYRFTQPLADATELQPNSPLSAFRFADLQAGGPPMLLGVPNPVFGRFDLGRYGEILRGRSGFTTPYHVFTPGRSIVNLDPFIDVVFPGLAYWSRIDPLGVLLQLQARSVPTNFNYRVVHEDSDATGTLPVYDLSNGRLTYATTNGFTVGWRMIGNPFPFPISYNSIIIRFQGQAMTLTQALANSPILLSSTFFRFDSSLASSGGYALDMAPSGTLNPFEGVWINFQQPVQVEIAPLRTTSSRVLASTPPPDNENWRMRLSARAGTASDVHNYLGLSGAAQDTYDGRDVPEAPDHPGSHLRLSLLGSAAVSSGNESRSLMRLMQDLRRGPLSVTQKYEFEVTTDLTNTDVQLSWDDAARVPARYRLTLVDLESGRRLYMRTTSGFGYNSGAGGTRLFRIEVEPEAGTRMQISTLLAAQTADGRSVRLSYSLTQTATVQTQVVNSAGKVVRRFPNQAGSRGLNSLVWDARDDAGRRLPRGLYLIQLIAQTDEQQEGRAVASVTLR